MGNCIYCGKPAGIFRTSHRECQEAEDRRLIEEQQRQRAALERLENVASIALTAGGHLSDVAAARDEALSADVSIHRANNLLAATWKSAIDRALDDGIIDETELGRLKTYLDALCINREEVNGDNHFDRMVQGVVLGELLSGQIPQRFDFGANCPVNLQAGERIVWGFPDTRYLEMRTRTERIGGSTGVSLRIMSGVYYRVGAFKSVPVQKTEYQPIDTGWLVVTDRHLYFTGPAKALRIPYGKIVNFDPYSDGIGLTKDAASARPQLFINGNGWFLYNLVTNLARR